MTADLDRQLIELGSALELPPAPDLTPAVLARLTALRRRRRPARRTLAIALAAALLLAGAAMAVPASRHAILRILGLRGVTIERVQHLPPIQASKLGLGQRIPLDRARDAAGFTALLPPGSTAAYVSHDIPGGRLSLLIGRMLIIEFRGTTTPFIAKVIGPGTAIRMVRVNGGPGAYLSGTPHEVLFETQKGQFRTDRVRLAGNVLIWQQGTLTIRIEGARSLDQARALARSLR